MIYENDYLEHYGVKGQKWGVRRFQNEDGTLTSEGRQRLGYRAFEGIKQALKTTGSKAASSIKKTASTGKANFIRKHKPVSAMSDQELRDRLNRMNMEKQYKQLQDEKSGKNKTFSQKHPIIDRVLVSTATQTLSNLVSRQLGTKADELLADKRMMRAQKKGMLDESKFPFVYNTSARISSYNNSARKKEEAAKSKQKAIDDAVSEAIKTAKSKLTFHPTNVKERSGKEGVRIAWNGLEKKLAVMPLNEMNNKSVTAANGADLIRKALEKKRIRGG